MFEIGQLTRLPLGYVGESGTRTISIDMKAWLDEYPGALIMVQVIRPVDHYKYPAAYTKTDGVIHWTVDGSEVMYAGKGLAQIALYNPDTKQEYKSRVVGTIVAESLDGFNDIMMENNDPASKWVNQVLEAANVASSAQEKAEEVMNSIPRDYKTLSGNVSALTEETAKNTEAIDSLNKGGLVMKEDFIGQQVNDWLDEHPEATTTVKDHSLTVDKLVIGTLGYVTPQMYGAVADGVTDDADALEAAILAGHKNIMIPENTTMQISGLTLSDIDGVTIDNRGKIVNAKGGPIIRQQGCSNVHLTGGEWFGDGSTDSQSLIVLDGCMNCHIDNMHISGAKNKAVEIKGNTTGCMVECLHIVSANGSSGAGVSLWGAEVKHNIISHIYCEDVRLAIAANGCSYNTFDDITCVNTASKGGGVLFDGMVSYSGDGAHDNVLSNLVVVNAGQYGGLYFGNGAHGNTCENIAVADSNHGVRMYSEQATPCYGNTVRGGTIKNCSESGVVLSLCNDNEVSGFVITNCPRGVDLYAASHNSVHDCIVCDCTINGIRVMTDYASIANCKVRGCASGIELAYGSGKNPTDIMIEGTWLIDNTTQYTPANGIQLGSTCRQLTTA